MLSRECVRASLNGELSMRSRPLWRKFFVLPRFLAAWAVLFLRSALYVLAAQRGGFLLQDFLNHRWQNECVRFPVSESQFEDAKAGKALVGPEGKARSLSARNALIARRGCANRISPMETLGYMDWRLSRQMVRA